MPLVSIVASDLARAAAVASAQSHAGLEIVARAGEARGEYVQWIGASDELAPDKIAIQAAVLEASRADVACGAHVDGRAYGPPIATDDPLLEALAGVPFEPPLAAFLVRRAMIETLGDASLGMRELVASAAMLGARFVATPNAITLAPRPEREPARARAAADAAVFERLRQRAESSREVRDVHRRFLDQRWSTYRLATRPVTANARTRGLGALGTVVGRAIAASMAVDTLEGFTHRARTASPRVEREIVRVRDAVEALAENGLLIEEA